ncbi:MAG: cytochrome P450 [Acidimicrobiia bacterium]
MTGTAPHIDLLAGDLYGDRAREAYTWMRAHSPVHFDEKNAMWGLATYDAVLSAERDAKVFSNAGGSRPDTGPLPWMIDLDAPEHLKRRKLVNRGFTPARVRASEPQLGRICDELIDRVCEQGECDFVHDIAAPLPMIVIGDMLGIPPEDRGLLLAWSDAMLASLSGDPEHLEAAGEAFLGYQDYAQKMMAARRESGAADDLIGVLVHAEIDGDRLEDHEIVMETLLLLVGGDETTRHVTTGGMEQLLVNPDQRQQLVDDPTLLPSALEEMLRWVSPIKNMARTVTRDVELAGRQLHAGDRALLLYESANFDDGQFKYPERFDIERSPNEHLAFGFGPHFCLGASLARLELQTMFERLLTRLPDLELVPDASYPRFLGQLAEMPVRFTPVPRVLE